MRSSEIDSLIARWQEKKDERAREQLVSHYLDEIDEIARRLAAIWHSEFDDLRSAGYLGLLAAADSYDRSRRVPFGAWMAMKAEWEMLSEQRRRYSLPKASFALERRRRKVEAELAQMFGRSATVGEVAAALGIAEHELQRHLELADRCRVISLDEPFPGGEERIALLADRALLAHDRTADADPIEALVPLYVLSERERELIERHYLGGERVDEIARSAGISRSRVYALLRQALSKLRHQIREQEELALAA